MAKPIDKSTYRAVEWRLHNRKSMQAELDMLRNDVLQSGYGVDYTKPKTSPTNRCGDDVLDKVLKLEARTRDLQSWLDVIDAAMRYFDGLKESALFELFYGKTVSNDLVADALGVNRRELARLRDNVVYRCAMIAASKKLLDFVPERRKSDG